MRNKRFEVEEAENGFTIKVYNHEESDKDNDFGYVEPKILVAKDVDEVTTEMKKCFGKGDK